MRTLHYFNRYTLLIGILLAAVVFSPGPGTGRAAVALHDAAHAPVFACVTLLALALLRRFRPRGIALQYLVAFTLAVALGAATEIVQKLTGRDASWLDLTSDAIGAFAACGIFAAFDARLPRPRLRACAAIVGIGALALHSLQFARVGVAYAHRNQEFPVLFAASDARPDRFLVAQSAAIVYANLPAALASYPNEPALRVLLSKREFPGVALEEPYPDWSRQTQLKLELANPTDERLILILRVLDQAHDWDFGDRFNRTLSIEPQTRTTFSIPIEQIARAPATRTMDMRSIADLRLFADERNVAGEFFLTRAWLE